MKADKCRICGHSNDMILEEHHIIPKNHNGPDEEWNLVTLCPSCHVSVTKIYSKKIWREANKIDTRSEASRNALSEEQLNDEAEELF